MTIEKVLRQALDSRIVQLLKNLKELAALITGYLVFAQAPFGAPDLEVRYRVDTLRTPTRSAYVWDSLMQSPTKLPTALAPVYGLLTSEHLVTVTFTNRTDKSITDLDLQIVPTASVGDIGITSTAAVIVQDADRLAKYDCCKQATLSFPELRSLPPRSKTVLQVWGVFAPSLSGDIVRVVTAGKEPAMYYEARTSGVPRFIAENLSALLLTLGALLFVLGLYRIGRSNEIRRSDTA